MTVCTCPPGDTPIGVRMVSTCEVHGDKTKHLSEDWLLANLPEGWTYDCQFGPIMAFTITATDGKTLTLPLRLLK